MSDLLHIQRPSVCAVIPVRNRCSLTERFLERFTQQSYSNLKIVIVDSNSSDGTQDMVISRYPQAKLILATDEHFWTGATNLGVSWALKNNYDYILTINDDSLVSVDLVKQLVMLALSQSIAILGCRIDYLKSPGLIWSLGSYSRWGTRHIFQLRYQECWVDDLPANVQEKDYVEVEAMPGNGVLIHRSVFEKIGLYNEKYLVHYHSDSELIMRALRQGFHAFVATKIVVYNDCDINSGQIQLRIKTVQQFYSVFLKKRSSFYYIPILFMIFNYCPFYKIPSTVFQFFLFPIFLPVNEAFSSKSRFLVRKSRVKILRLLSRLYCILRNFK